jgi:chromosome segregation ATPase
MSSLDAAQKRLEDALRRVETALGQRPRGGAGVSPGPQYDASAFERELAQLGAERDALAGDVDELRRECGRLSEALDAVQRDNAELRQINEQVARRLDGTIDELQRLLEA